MQEYKPNKYDIATQPDGLGYLVRPHDSLKVFLECLALLLGGCLIYVSEKINILKLRKICHVVNSENGAREIS